MLENPFKASVLALIKTSPMGLSEYDLIQRLQEHDAAFVFDGENPNLVLFRKHFLVMNALYQLQMELFAQGMYLSISPLDIRLEPVESLAVSALPTDNAAAPLRAYYLDWENFSQTSHADVEFMLNRFTERYLAIDERLEALQTLELSADAPWETIKQAYRRLAAQHHPDKGGDPARFRAIRGAYEILMRCYGV
ncbi:MAG: DNA-J related domain-containing protein [Sulfuricaulis sp.]|uniref:DNA-J related domain-containing protein n=1 Tax=Sulfuricaulis sp. TaxID=2003553 RepID=UPI003C3B0474